MGELRWTPGRSFAEALPSELNRVVGWDCESAQGSRKVAGSRSVDDDRARGRWARSRELGSAIGAEKRKRDGERRARIRDGSRAPGGLSGAIRVCVRKKSRWIREGVQRRPAKDVGDAT
jgi:hypothetical protein